MVTVTDGPSRVAGVPLLPVKFESLSFFIIILYIFI